MIDNVDPVDLTFAFAAAAGRPNYEPVMLASSIRTYAGRFADSPIWVLVPERGSGIGAQTKEKLLNLETQIIPYSIDEYVYNFPFGNKVVAAASAELLAADTANILVWMDVDSIVLAEPNALILDDHINLGYRPVDHILVGSPYDGPVDRFWERVYHLCHLSEGDLFPITTTVDQRVIRPYFNAGMLVARPGVGLLRRWCETFLALYRDPILEKLYQANTLYKIFIHQAILAGEIVATVDQQALFELPPSVNYPLHMHSQYPVENRPATLDELVTCRYDTLFQDPDWPERIPKGEPFERWLKAQIEPLVS